MMSIFLMTMDSKRHATFFLAAIVLRSDFRTFTSIIYSRGKRFWHRLNFLTLWQAFDSFRSAHPQATLQRLHFISFEKFPLTRDDLALAHQHWPELAPWAEQLQAQWPLPPRVPPPIAGSGPGDTGFVVWRY